MQGKLSSQTFATNPKEKGARDLVKSWCSAYGQSDADRLAASEMLEVEIVDRFGDWHHLTGLQDRERFWREGFDIIRSKDFNPQCIIEDVRLIRLDVAIAQARITYDQGIGLKGGDRIPPFSEIHTFVLMKSDDTWLISAQDIVQRISLE
jgi:ketosteroid isomerase-like protein